MQKITLSTLALTAAVIFVIPCVYNASAESLDSDVKKSERAYRKTAVGKGALSKKMIEDCIVLKTDIDLDYAEIADSKEQFDALNKETTDLGAELKKNKEQAESDGGEVLTEYNKQVELYNRKVEELKEQEEAYNKTSAPYQKKVDKLKKECDGQPYYEDDYAATVKKMGRGL